MLFVDISVVAGYPPIQISIIHGDWAISHLVTGMLVELLCPTLGNPHVVWDL